MTYRLSSILASSRLLGDGANRDRCVRIAAALAISIVALVAPIAKAAEDWAAGAFFVRMTLSSTGGHRTYQHQSSERVPADELCPVARRGE